MSNKYIEKFFWLTEQNIVVNSFFLQQVYLGRMDAALVNPTDLDKKYMQQAQVMDKVLVVPKLFG